MSVEDIVLGMGYQTLTAIKSRTNCENINTIHRQIYANAASVDSLHGGAHGHLRNVTTPVTYLTVTATPYNNPPSTGPQSPRTLALFPQQWDGMKAAHKWQLKELIHPTALIKQSENILSKPLRIHSSSNQYRISSPDYRK
jgi:hypothetical protein